jgi:hypothetical protein
MGYIRALKKPTIRMVVSFFNGGRGGIRSAPFGRYHAAFVRCICPFGQRALRVRILDILIKNTKPIPCGMGFVFLAEEVGFEPTVPCGTPHFECGSL